MKSTTVADISQCLLNKARTEQFAGYDPFDGLNSSWFKRLPISKDSIFGLAWIQLFKRSPINLRPWLGVPKARNPKGVALFILGLIEEYQVTKDPALLTEAEQLAQWLVTQRCDEQIWHGACWGYHFDWKARAFFVPKGKPNVITTVYVSRALHQLGQLTGRADWVDLALGSGDFIAGHLLTQNESGEFFAYIPGETAFVHNASLWAAAWLAVVGRETSRPDYTELALRIARNSAQAQAADGSWAYGTRHHHGFIDGFHTGYNLEALHLIRTTLATNEFDEAIARGFHFYKQHLFEADERRSITTTILIHWIHTQYHRPLLPCSVLVVRKVMLFWLNASFSVLFKRYTCLSGISLSINVTNVGLTEFTTRAGHRRGCTFHSVFI
ncbi:hypothetical protein V130003_19120 [Vibrio cholerae]|nr:hypothetical protein V130003_19120 [Vibrio cholerae]